MENPNPTFEDQAVSDGERGIRPLPEQTPTQESWKVVENALKCRDEEHWCTYVDLIRSWVESELPVDFRDREDVFQDVLTNVYEALAHRSGFPGFGSIQRLRGYVRTAAHNRMCDILRHRKVVEKHRESVIQDGSSDTMRQAGDTIEKDEHGVRAALRKLPDRERDVLVLQYLEELTVDETSKRLGVPKDVVYRRRANAKVHLQELLRPKD